MGRACDNCGFEADELVLVRRVYVTPESWETSASAQVLDDPELWCVSCTTQYPYEAADQGEEVHGDA